MGKPKILIQRQTMQDTIWQGTWWRITMATEFTLPGYLFIAPTDLHPAQFGELDRAAAMELGWAQTIACSSLEAILQPQNILCGRYGLMPGNPIHFHVVPIFQWVFDAFAQANAYEEAFRAITPATYPAHPDGAALLSFVWRELCVKKRALFEFNPAQICERLAAQANSINGKGDE